MMETLRNLWRKLLSLFGKKYDKPEIHSDELQNKYGSVNEENLPKHEQKVKPSDFEQYGKSEITSDDLAKKYGKADGKPAPYNYEEDNVDFGKAAVEQKTVETPEPEGHEKYIINLHTQEDGEAFIEKLRDISNIEDFLNNCNNQSLAEKYLNYINRYLKAVNKKYTGFDIEDYDEDEINADIASNVIDIIKKRLSNYIIGAYRGMVGSASSDEEKIFYKGLLEQIEIFLTNLGFEKVNIHVGDSIRGYEEMFELVSKDTTNPRENNTIEEIELSPYTLSYIDENGEVETMNMEGRCVVLVNRQQ